MMPNQRLGQFDDARNVIVWEKSCSGLKQATNCGDEFAGGTRYIFLLREE